MKDWAKKTRHSTAADAAKMAKLANTKKLIIGHFSARYKNVAPLIEEAKAIFEETVAAVDGKTYKVKSRPAEKAVN
ncbi:MAG: ribonuclease Z, partial [Prolixibacteraceae bacterium]|nr:ribonuclease Z [Prolixibacteraceae bacterium]